MDGLSSVEPSAARLVAYRSARVSVAMTRLVVAAKTKSVVVVVDVTVVGAERAVSAAKRSLDADTKVLASEAFLAAPKPATAG